VRTTAGGQDQTRGHFTSPCRCLINLFNAHSSHSQTGSGRLSVLGRVGSHLAGGTIPSAHRLAHQTRALPPLPLLICLRLIEQGHRGKSCINRRHKVTIRSSARAFATPAKRHPSDCDRPSQFVHRSVGFVGRVGAQRRVEKCSKRERWRPNCVRRKLGWLMGKLAECSCAELSAIILDLR